MVTVSLLVCITVIRLISYAAELVLVLSLAHPLTIADHVRSCPVVSFSRPSLNYKLTK